MSTNSSPPRLGAEVLGAQVRERMEQVARNVRTGLIWPCAHLGTGATRHVHFDAPRRALCRECLEQTARRLHANDPDARGRCVECGGHPLDGTVHLHLDRPPYSVRVNLCRECAHRTGLWDPRRGSARGGRES